MNDTDAITIYLEDPDKLVALCQDVVNELTTVGGLEEEREESRQLIEISKTIDRLEKDGISVPEVLRGEKARLSGVLSDYEEAVAKLEKLKVGLQSVCADINVNGNGSRRGETKRLSRNQLDIIGKAIVENLERAGGSKHCNPLIRELSQSLRSTEVGPIIFEDDGEISGKFRNACYFRAHRMRKRGVLKQSDQAGIWELEDNHR